MRILAKIKKALANDNNKRILLGAALAALLLCLSAPVTQAAATSTQATFPTPVFLGECTGDGALGILCAGSQVVQYLILGLLSVIGSLFGWILGAMTSLTLWAIGDLGIKITTHAAVSEGFKISLAVANIVFVVAVIMIAFATIIRWHEYEAKKLLSKLIITALLVNFSLLAAGLMLDASNVFTNFFITQDKVSAGAIGSALSPQAFSAPAAYGSSLNTPSDILARVRAAYAAAMDDTVLPDGQQIFNAKSRYRYFLGGGVPGETITQAAMSREEFEREILNNDARLAQALASGGAADNLPGEAFGEVDISEMWKSFLDLLPRVIFSVFATFIAMITMVAMFVMALIRNIWVIVLLIVMPVAWSMRVLPKFEQYWQKWWEKFLNWGILYLPTVSFFLYLAVQAADSTRNSLSGPGTSTTFGGVVNGTLKTAGFLGESVNGGPSLISSLVLMLIVIGIMIAGLKIAQAMGAGVAGVAASLAGKGSRKLAGGLLKVGTTPTAFLGKVGFGLGAGTIAAAYKAIKPNKVTETDSMGASTTTQEGRGKSAAGGFKAGWNAFAAPNLYGRTTELMSRGMAGMSGIPIIGGALGAGAQFFGKLSASQATAVDAAVKETDGLSPAALKAWIKSASMKDAAHQAAAMALADKNHMHDAIGHDDLKKFADSVASLNPGAERDKIDVLKAFASHNPEHAEDVLGSKAGVDRFVEAVRGADTAAVQSWGEAIYDKAKKYMSTSQKRAWAGRDGSAQYKVMAEELQGLEKVLDKLPKNMADDIRLALKKDGHKDEAVMKRVEGHLEKISASKPLKKIVNQVDGALKSLNAALAVSRNTTLRTKSKSDHPVHGDINYTLGAILKRLAGATIQGGKAGSGGGPKPKASSGGDGHGHGH